MSLIKIKHWALTSIFYCDHWPLTLLIWENILLPILPEQQDSLCPASPLLVSLWTINLTASMAWWKITRRNFWETSLVMALMRMKMASSIRATTMRHSTIWGRIKPSTIKAQMTMKCSPTITILSSKQLISDKAVLVSEALLPLRSSSQIPLIPLITWNLLQPGTDTLKPPVSWKG